MGQFDGQSDRQKLGSFRPSVFVLCCDVTELILMGGRVELASDLVKQAHRNILSSQKCLFISSDMCWFCIGKMARTH